MIIKIKVVEWG